jgi:hypothetical protein
MKTQRFARLFVLPAALALTTFAAHADTFDWSLTAPAASLGGFTVIGSGTITATAPRTGDSPIVAWTINSITGTADGSAITGLAIFDGSDNLLYPDNSAYPDSTLLDTDGLGFSLANGTEVNVFSFYAPGSTDITPGNNFGEEVSTSGFGVGTFSLVDITASPVPEPSTLALFGTGLLGVVGAARRKLFRA